MLKEDETNERINRHEETQEDFTPENIVCSLFNNFENNIFLDFSKTVIDYSAGTGNLLLHVLEKRLENSTCVEDSLSALRTIFGVEIMADNVEECRNRLYNLFYKKHGDASKDEAMSIIKDRIRWGDSLNFDYDSWEENVSIDHNVDFHESRTDEDTKYPLWHKDKKSIALF